MKSVLIGAGRMGRRHMDVLRGLDLKVAGVCDAKPEILAELASTYDLGESKLFSSASVLFESTKPELAVVATTAPSHAELVIRAAKAGVKYLLCEKPMATSLNECEEMLKVCGENGAKLAINHQMRFMEQYTMPKELLESETFGGISSISVISGNFGVAMNGSHYFEMFRYMTGENVSEVTSWFSEDTIANPRGQEFRDRAGAVRLTNNAGHRFYLEAGSDQGHGVTVIYSGRNGHIIVEELEGIATISYREEQYRDLPTTRYGMPAKREIIKISPADSTAPTKSVLEALLTDGDYPTGQQGKHTVEVLVAAHISNENDHRTINLSIDPLPQERKFSWA